ncbi:hypothetical protein [Candidatus Blochmanniella vafra]|nr:hypothetical protein [Candidatus Blochmannia vafer]
MLCYNIRTIEQRCLNYMKCKKNLSIEMKILTTSGLIRVLVVLMVLSCLWLVIIWTSISCIE